MRDARASAPDLELEEVSPGGSLPRAALLSPDGSAFYVIDSGALDTHNVAIYDARTLAPRGHIDVPGRVVDAVFSPADPTRLFVAGYTRDEVSEIDVRTGQRLHFARMRAGTRPKAIAISKDGRTVYTADWGTGTLSQINTMASYEVSRVPAGRNPRALALSSSGKLYVANFHDASIDVFDVHGGGPPVKVDRVASCAVPRDLALSPDERTLYVTCYRDWELHAIDLATGQPSHRVRVGAAPRGIEISRDGRFVWSADYGSASTVSVVDTTDWTAKVYPVPGMDRGGAVAVAADGHHALVAGWYDEHVYLVGFRGEGGHPREALAAVQGWVNVPRQPDPAP
jgi:DNA-binding beta-propeller fold protein YncE